MNTAAVYPSFTICALVGGGTMRDYPVTDGHGAVRVWPPVDGGKWRVTLGFTGYDDPRNAEFLDEPAAIAHAERVAKKCGCVPRRSLLALYAHAIALRGSARAAWARVDAYRAEHSVSGHGRGNEGGEQERAEDAALCDAFHAADKAEHDSIVDLCAAVQAAEWGQQPDGSFVSRTSVTCGGWQHHHVLHAPAKQGPLCEVRDYERGNGCRLVALRTREEAREIAIALRCDNRDAERVYAALRRRAGEILRAGGALPFCPGQEYGTLQIHERYVSARGALVAAGLTKEAAIDLLLTCESSGMLTLSGLTGEPYPNPREW